ncbi:MAG: Holliday junction resolvase RecU [Candidatus Izemoplasmatales bacterium]|nr:Holliday junction resolvase RecU [Candidatus Izemoplasmatales bacterium]MDD4596231.1 Holliday junction resolvase RecU [Candidatus Izemoplasmatales bacterium]
MINYPIIRKSMQTKTVSTSNRGMDLEAAINETNEYYINNDIAYIYKKPIPIQVVKVDYERRSAARISEAYYKVPSTTDYNGIYQGKYIDFEAKETKTKTAFPMKNIHEHQVKHLENIIRHGGIGFVIVAFTALNKIFLLEAHYVIDYYQRSESGRKSITYQEFATYGYEIKESYAKRIDYLKIIDQLYFQGK